MAAVIYSLCTLTCLVAAVLLLRTWRRTRAPLLLWSGLCFAGLTGSNTVLVLDHTVFLEQDLSTLRLAVAFVALMLLIFGLVWEAE
jgi:hypothetical protein